MSQRKRKQRERIIMVNACEGLDNVPEW